MFIARVVPDHPRSRGVYASPGRRPVGRLGSSPLARGLLPAGSPLLPLLRIIPARAGFTMFRTCFALAKKDHPRSRGVYDIELVKRLAVNGSSPLARGLRSGTPCGVEDWRIIPARAGFTCRPTRARSTRPDHPRSRGVYPVWALVRLSVQGSSPLARGLRPTCTSGRSHVGIIPARAGFTCTAAPGSSCHRDHPRSRGVYTVSSTLTPSNAGSSPLARGLLEGHARVHRQGRIIPARAGFTTARCRTTRSPEDHPRSRGVYYLTPTERRSLAGSSPLARGLLGWKRGTLQARRIIPARAGFTERRFLRQLHRGDHPRSRGVYKIKTLTDENTGGSSPLARGLRNYHDFQRPARWIIPARAGFTACPL